MNVFWPQDFGADTVVRDPREVVLFKHDGRWHYHLLWGDGVHDDAPAIQAMLNGGIRLSLGASERHVIEGKVVAYEYDDVAVWEVDGRTSGVEEILQPLRGRHVRVTVEVLPD